MKLEIKFEDTKVTGILSGRLDTAASQQFITDMQPIFDAADKHIYLDCSNLDFISSSDLRIPLPPGSTVFIIRTFQQRISSVFVSNRH